MLRAELCRGERGQLKEGQTKMVDSAISMSSLLSLAFVAQIPNNVSAAAAGRNSSSLLLELEPVTQNTILSRQ